MEVGNMALHKFSKVNELMSIFRMVLDKLFIQKDHNINVMIVLNKLKEKNIDIEKVKAFMDTLPEGSWNIKTFMDNVEKLNEMFGLSDAEITEYSVSNVTEEDIKTIRWEVLVESMLEYSRFSTEFYDALKYNNTEGLSISQIKLLNELMMVFKVIKKSSKEIYEQFHNRRLSEQVIKKFNICRIPIEFLVLRILYIALNLKDADDKKFDYFAKLLGTERISITYQKQFALRYS